MNDDRREVLQNMAVLALASAGAAASAETVPTLATAFRPGPLFVGPHRTSRTPGKPGDFGFLDGQWSIINQRKREGRLETFEGEARCFSILGGMCSVEELLIPERDFSGMGLRILNVKTRVWSDHWVNAKSGVVGVAATPGSFEGGAGVFETSEGETLFRNVWDLITPKSCRWQQGASKDGGKTWELDWSMAWTRRA